MECEFDVLSLNTAGIVDSSKELEVFNYLRKNCSSKRVIFLDVGKVQCFLHMGLQIAVVHLLPSENDLAIRFYPVISMIMLGMLC